ncbi:hypothetical protein BVY03_00960, partial [bacterium K02(2017)]
MYILGISAYYHDAAASLIKDDEIIACAQEERFTRIKQDSKFPINAIKYCLDEAGINFQQIDTVVYYEKPIIKFERLVDTYLSYAPSGLRSFLSSMPVWLKEKLFLKKVIQKEIKKNFSVKNCPILFTEHHQSHAASAFFPSPFKEAVVLCIDGVGEWSTTSVWHGSNNTLKPLWELRFPHSLGLLYAAFTYYTGFKVNSGEYKVMGLAPYGQPKYKQKILDHIVDVKDDGTFRLNMEYFNFCTGLTMVNDKFNKLFGGSPRKPESEVTQKEMDLARSIQEVTEEIVLKLAKNIQKETGLENLCLAGGVALNCVVNGRLQREGAFKNIWIQPAAGDAGGALGAAMCARYVHFNKSRPVDSNDKMKGTYLG